MYSRKRWIMRGNPWRSNIESITNYTDIAASILQSRGIADICEISKFLSPELTDMYDPYLLPDMRKSIEIISKSIISGDKITIYGDYDTDGVTATSILYLCLKSLNAEVSYYIPRRDDEGYGLNNDAIDEILSQGTKLIITVDCGVSSIMEVEYCKKAGAEIIITDHHECGERLPDTLVINPKRPDSLYPFKELAGAGVAFKLIQALSSIYDYLDPNVYLELTAIGTIADIVPLTDENRVIAKFGLDEIKKTKNNGIRAIIESSGINIAEVNARNISFSIAPRINAIGRIESADIGVELFTAPDMSTALLIAGKLEAANKKRQEIEENIFKDADSRIESICLPENDYIFVLESGEWHMGVIGIVASKLVEKYHRPVVLISSDNGICRGSARSIQGFNIYDALTECSDLLIKFGGHELAAGLSISSDKIHSFIERIKEYAKNKISPASFIPILYIDCEINTKIIDLGSVDDLSKIEPFGAGNPPPMLMCRNFFIDEIRTVGVNNKHLKLKLHNGNCVYDAIAFNMGYFTGYFSRGNVVDAAFELSRNVWNGNEKVQLLIRDIRFSMDKSMENNYYRSLKNFLERFGCSADVNVSKLPMFKINEKPLEDILDEIAAGDRCLVMLGNINSLEYFSGLMDYFEICFESNINCTASKTVVIVNPDIGKVRLEGIDSVYLFDNVLDYLSVINTPGIFDNRIWYICSTNFKKDIDYIYTLKPSVNEIENIYKHLSNSAVRGVYNCSINSLSHQLSLNNMKIYYALKSLHNSGALTICASKNSLLLIKINLYDKIVNGESSYITKFGSVIDMLSKINMYFQKDKGEYEWISKTI